MTPTDIPVHWTWPSDLLSCFMSLPFLFTSSCSRVSNFLGVMLTRCAPSASEPQMNQSTSPQFALLKQETGHYPPLRPNIHVVMSVLIFPVRWPCCSSPLHGHLGSGREQHVNNTSDGLRFLDFFSSQSNWTFVLPTHFSVLYPQSICPEFFHQL